MILARKKWKKTQVVGELMWKRRNGDLNLTAKTQRGKAWQSRDLKDFQPQRTQRNAEREPDFLTAKYAEYAKEGRNPLE